MTMPADRERDRRSLQDLAKMAQGMTPPPPASVRGLTPPSSSVQRAAEATKEDSGIVDLAAAAVADPQASVRAQTTPLASQGLFDEEPLSQRPPVSHAPTSAPMQPAPSVPPSMPASSRHAYAQAPSVPAGVLERAEPPYAPVHSIHPQKKGSGAAIAFALSGIVALGAVAAGGFLYMKSKKANETVAMATTQPKQVDQAPPSAAKETTPAADPSPDSPSTVGALPAAAPHEAKVAAKGAPGKSSPVAKHEPDVTPPPAEKTEAPAKMTEKDLAPAAGGGPSNLIEGIQKEVGDKDNKGFATKPAAATPTGNVPQKPSQGAVTGALGAVLPGARACLGPDDPISRASVVFGSDGSVQSVNVSGGAAGKPAETCIKEALTKAKVQPFAEPSYTANITIRHN